MVRESSRKSLLNNTTTINLMNPDEDYDPNLWTLVRITEIGLRLSDDGIPEPELNDSLRYIFAQDPGAFLRGGGQQEELAPN